MNILCITHNTEKIYFQNSPGEELEGHSVTEVHTKEDALLMLRDGQFDIILCDLNFPHHSGDIPGPYGALFCLWQDIPEFQRLYKVKTVGIFVPEYLTETFFIETPDNDLVCIATNNCKTPRGQRDWKRLVGMITFRLERIGVALD